MNNWGAWANSAKAQAFTSDIYCIPQDLWTITIHSLRAALCWAHGPLLEYDGKGHIYSGMREPLKIHRNSIPKYVIIISGFQKSQSSDLLINRTIVIRFGSSKFECSLWFNTPRKNIGKYHSFKETSFYGCIHSRDTLSMLFTFNLLHQAWQ